MINGKTVMGITLARGGSKRVPRRKVNILITILLVLMTKILKIYVEN